MYKTCRFLEWYQKKYIKYYTSSGPNLEAIGWDCMLKLLHFSSESKVPSCPHCRCSQGWQSSTWSLEAASMHQSQRFLLSLRMYLHVLLTETELTELDHLCNVHVDVILNCTVCYMMKCLFSIMLIINCFWSGKGKKKIQIFWNS